MISDYEIRQRIKKLNIEKRAKEDRYYARITIDGVRKSIYGHSEAEVKNKATEYLRSLNDPDPKYVSIDKKDDILLQDVMFEFLTQKKWNTIEKSSYTRLFRVYECQIKDKIGLYKVSDIDTELIQTYIDSYAYASEVKDQLAHSGLQRYKQIISMTLDYAVANNLTEKNFAKEVVIPRAKFCQKKTKEQFSLTDEEIVAFKNAALTIKNEEYLYQRNGLLLLLMLNLGIRVGELLVLEWSDFNIKKGHVKINNTLQSNVMLSKDDSSVYVDFVDVDGKTASSKRVIPLNDTIIEIIDELKLYDKKHKIKCKTVANYDQVTKGRAQNLQRTLDRICARAGIKNKVTLHTLRHTFGSKLIRSGVDISIVSKLLGHKNITITYNTYIHVIQEQAASAMKFNGITS